MAVENFVQPGERTNVGDMSRLSSSVGFGALLQSEIHLPSVDSRAQINVLLMSKPTYSFSQPPLCCQRQSGARKGKFHATLLCTKIPACTV